jgi:hypothetical protein
MRRVASFTDAVGALNRHRVGCSHSRHPRPHWCEIGLDRDVGKRGHDLRRQRE